MLLRSGLMLAPLAPVLHTGAPLLRRIFSLKNNKISLESDVKSGTIQWKHIRQALIVVGHRLCLRRAWLCHSLRAIRTLLKPKMLVRVTWREPGSPWVASLGQVSEDSTASSTKIFYEDVGLQPFPPIPGIRIRKVEIERISTSVHSLVAKKAEVGVFISMKFKRHDTPLNWSGVVVAVHSNKTCLVKWFRTGDTSVVYIFPPPKSAAITIEEVRFYSRKK